MLGLGTVTAALLTVADALAGIGARPGGGALSESPSLAPAPGDKGWPGNYGRRKSKTGGDMPGFLRPARGGPTAGGAPRRARPGSRPVAAVARRAASRQAPAAQERAGPAGDHHDHRPRRAEDLEAAVEREAPSPDRPYPPRPELPAGPALLAPPRRHHRPSRRRKGRRPPRTSSSSSRSGWCAARWPGPVRRHGRGRDCRGLDALRECRASRGVCRRWGRCEGAVGVRQ